MGSAANVTQREPWNKGKIVGQEAPFKPKDIWALRVRLQMESRVRELALFTTQATRDALQWAASSPNGGYVAPGQTGGPGHKPSLPARSKILPQRAYERQVSGGEFEPLFGPTRPTADIDDCLLPATGWLELPALLFHEAFEVQARDAKVLADIGHLHGVWLKLLRCHDRAADRVGARDDERVSVATTFVELLLFDIGLEVARPPVVRVVISLRHGIRVASEGSTKVRLQTRLVRPAERTCCGVTPNRRLVHRARCDACAKPTAAATSLISPPSTSIAAARSTRRSTT